MKVEIIEIGKLVPYENNPRKNLNVDKVAKSIQEFGFQQPIVTDKDMKILVGHTRYFASKKLNLDKVPVVIADLDSSKAKAYRIADNRVAQDSSWDLPKLNLEIASLKEDNFNIDILGFEDLELDKFAGRADPVFEASNDVVENINYQELDAPVSGVRMIQLFLDQQTEPKFKQMVDFFKKEYNTENLTDTVYSIVENAYNKCQTNSN